MSLLTKCYASRFASFNWSRLTSLLSRSCINLSILFLDSNNLNLRNDQTQMILTICFFESILLLDYLSSIILHHLSYLIDFCSISIFNLISFSSLLHSSTISNHLSHLIDLCSILTFNLILSSFLIFVSFFHYIESSQSSQWSLLDSDFHFYLFVFSHMSYSFIILNHLSHLDDFCSILTFTLILSSSLICFILLLYWIISIISLIFARFWHSLSFSRVFSSLSHSFIILNYFNHLINSLSISIFTRIQLSSLLTLLIWFSILIRFWYILLTFLTYFLFFNLFLFILFILCTSFFYSRNLSINVINLSDIISLHSFDIIDSLSHLFNHVQICWSILILSRW